MKARKAVLTLAVCLFGVGICFAANPYMGTWKLNEAKSKLVAGMTKNNTVMYEAAGDSVKVTVDGVDGSGKPAHNEWTGKFDGEDYPVTGDPSYDTRSYKKVNGNTMDLTIKKGGKVVGSGRIVVSADGKSRTVTLNTMDAMGMSVKSVAVYDKQ